MNKFYRANLQLCCFLLLGYFGLTFNVLAQDIKFIQCEAESLSNAECFRYTVFENREENKGKRITLNGVILKATESNKSSKSPVFYLAGGPGQGAAGLANVLNQSWMRKSQDLILIDQRGTGLSNPLNCTLSGTDENPQGYMEPFFQRSYFEKCFEELSEHTDVRYYTTPIAMEDINEIRHVLGYERIFIYGISGGTRSALVYLQKYDEHVDGVILNGAVPFSFKNPLYHAESVQLALNKFFQNCRNDIECSAKYGAIDQTFYRVFESLKKEPRQIKVKTDWIHSSLEIEIILSASNFAETIRAMMYSSARIERLPEIIHALGEDEFSDFARMALDRNRGLRTALQLGTLMTTTCTEDVSRIKPQEIDSAIGDSFLGRERVDTQIEACKAWPQGVLPEWYTEELKTKVPALFLSGSMDPVTQPKWAEAARTYFDSSRHIIVEGGHGVSNPCLNKIMMEFVKAKGNFDEINYNCLEANQ